MNDRKRVNLTVSPEQKEKWDDAVEENAEYNSLSDLIRQSVAHELADDAVEATSTKGAQSEGSAEEVAEVKERLERLEASFNELQDAMNTVVEEVTSDAITELRNRLFEELPAPSENGKSESEIVEAIDASPAKVRKVLDDIAETSLVTTVEGDDGTTLYKQGEEL